MHKSVCAVMMGEYVHIVSAQSKWGFFLLQRTSLMPRSDTNEMLRQKPLQTGTTNPKTFGYQGPFH